LDAAFWMLTGPPASGSPNPGAISLVDMVLALTARPRIEPAVMAKERCREIFPGVLPKAPL